MSLLMIPGPIEISDAVAQAASVRPESHVGPSVVEAFGTALERMRHVWLASDDAYPFAIPGGGTLAMEMAVGNLLSPGDRALVVNSGYFSDRMAEMLRRRGVDVTEVGAELGDAPEPARVDQALEQGDFKALFATHVDTSTGVRVDAQGLCGVARKHEVLSVFDGVCATAGERFCMAEWGADVYLTASQKAIGLPAGLALVVASPRAMAAREGLSAPPHMSVDFLEWLPIMRAYEDRRPAYFSTPPTTLVRALEVGLGEILGDSNPADAMAARFELHDRVARGFRAAWAALGLEMLPASEELAANTLSAVLYPDGVDASLVKAIGQHGVTVAGGLHPQNKATYFRVGHMGHVLTQPQGLRRTVEAVGKGLVSCGYDADPQEALRAFEGALE